MNSADVPSKLNWLFAQIAAYKQEKSPSGQKFRLMGLVAETIHIISVIRHDVLQRVEAEAVLDADIDIDYDEMAERVLQEELVEEDSAIAGGEEQAGESHGKEPASLGSNLTACGKCLAERLEPALQEGLERLLVVNNSLSLGLLTRLENEALGELSSVLTKIAVALERSRKDEEYVRLYEQEVKRFKGTKKERDARLNFEKWMSDACQDNPSTDDLEEYIVGRLVHLFEKNIFIRKVSPMQNRKCYQNEVNLDMLEDDHPLKKTIHKHYRVLRTIVDFRDGYLVVNAAKAGRYFYANRKEANAKSNRKNFLKYMLKIALAQEVHKRLIEEVRAREAAAQAEAERRAAEEAERRAAEEKAAALKAEAEAKAAAKAAQREKEKAGLNHFAPMKLLQEMLKGEWFKEMRSDERYDSGWTDQFVSALMASEWGDEIARDWAFDGARNRRMMVRAYVVGLLKDAGVLKGSYDAIAKTMGIMEKPRMFSRYMGNGKKQGYAEWVLNYAEGGSISRFAL